jgi:hypothetical protein
MVFIAIVPSRYLITAERELERGEAWNTEGQQRGGEAFKIKGRLRGTKSLFYNSFPLPFSGEGD